MVTRYVSLGVEVCPPTPSAASFEILMMQNATRPRQFVAYA